MSTETITDQKDNIVVGPLKMSAWRCVRARLGAAVSAANIAMAAIVTVGVIVGLGMLDLRYALAAMMLVVVLLPGAGAIFLMGKMMSPAAVRQTLDHVITLTPDGNLTVSWIAATDEDTAEDAKARRLPADITVTADSIKAITRQGDCYALTSSEFSEVPLLLPAAGITLPPPLLSKLDAGQYD